MYSFNTSANHITKTSQKKLSKDRKIEHGDIFLNYSGIKDFLCYGIVNF